MIAHIAAAAASTTAAAVAVSTLALTKAAPAARKIRLNLVLNQIDDTEVAVLDDILVLQCYANY